MSDLEKRLEQSLRLADKRGRRDVRMLTAEIAHKEEKVVALQAKIDVLKTKLAAAKIGITREEMRRKIEAREAKNWTK